LTSAAQNQLYGTIQGDYLGGNPFFQGAFQPAAQAATSAFNTAIGGITSNASKAGRYGSGAMEGLQTAAGVPLQCDEGSDFMTFRIGLFGLEKLLNVDRTVDLLEGALDQVMPGALAQPA
jgi:hypothetical protein